MMFFLTFHLSKIPEKNVFTRIQKILGTFTTLIINQHIIIISERSCDTEDWNNDAENSALSQRNKLYFKVY